MGNIQEIGTSLSNNNIATCLVILLDFPTCLVILLEAIPEEHSGDWLILVPKDNQTCWKISGQG